MAAITRHAIPIVSFSDHLERRAMSVDDRASTVLVTGGSGYVAGWIIVDLLRRGWTVRATIRDLARGAALRETWAAHAPLEQLSFHAADLLADRGWDDAAQGATHVIHAASPMPIREYRTHDLIEPARAGTRRVLEAVERAGARRIVMTSSTVAALAAGEAIHDETSWTDPAAPNLGNYGRAKTLAERDAWAMAEASDGALALTTILPAAIAGPLLGAPTGWSDQFRALLAGERPALPRIGFNFVHIRDVVDLHRHALMDDGMTGQRIVAASDFLWLRDIALLLRERYGERASKVPLRKVPDWLVRLIGLVNVDARLAAPSLGQRHAFNTKHAETLLGRPLLPASQAVMDSIDSLFAHGHP